MPSSPAPEPSSGGTPQADSEELALLADPLWSHAVALFNQGDWYTCHDAIEELWHRTQGPCRPVLQGILQVAVAHVHLERGNLRGATILLGEGLGRLQGVRDQRLNLDLTGLQAAVTARLQALQQDQDPVPLPQPRLEAITPCGPPGSL